MVRKTSSLDYDEDLALPMPKPRRARPESTEPSSPTVETSSSPSRPHLLKKRATTDPVIMHEPSGSEQVNSQEAGDGKKMSRFQFIKSKLSFKDLRKECAKDEATLRAPALPSSDSAKHKLRRTVTSTSMTTPAPNSQELRAQPKPVETNKSAIRAGIPPVPLSPTTVAPSGTFSHAQGTMAPVRAGSMQRKISPATSSLARAESSSKDENEALISSIIETSGTPKRHRQIGVARPSSEQRLSQPKSPTSWLPQHPRPDDTPHHLGELLEGPGKLNYLPATWVGNHDTCPPGKRPPTPTLGEEGDAINPIPSAYSSKNDAPVTSLPGYLPSFQERLQKANIPLDRPLPPEMQNRSTVTQVNEIVNIVRSIQRQTDVGINAIGKKLEDLSIWIGDQLKHQIEGISDLTQAKHELFAKQCEISREMMKFQLDVRLEIGVMERRFSMFEMKLLDELQAEIRALARSYENLCLKTEALVAKHSSDENQKFIEYQQQKNAEIENEIAHLKAQQRDKPKVFATALALQRERDSSSGDAESFIKQSGSTTLPVLPDTPVSSTRTRMPTVETKAPAALPRNISMSKKGFLKSTREVSSSPKDNKIGNKTGSDDAKRWGVGVFGFRRRRDTSDSSTSSGKFPWSSRRTKEDSTAIHEDTHSSRSSTPPIPPMPRSLITQAVDDIIDRTTNTATPSNIHPALRNSSQQATMREREILKEETENVSSQSGPGLVLSRSDEIQTTASQICPSLPIPASDDRASGLSPSGSVHSAIQELSSSNQVVDQGSSDDLHRMPLLADVAWEAQEWDKGSSVHENKSAGGESML